jgi:hypothetical protein
MENRIDELRTKYPDLSTVENRDMDGLVAEYLLGWKEKSIGPDGSGENESVILMDPSLPSDFRFPPKGKVHRAYLTARFTTDLRTAIDLAKMHGYRKLDISGDPNTLPRRIVMAILEGRSPEKLY